MDQYRTAGILNRDILWEVRDYLFFLPDVGRSFRFIKILGRLYGAVCLFFVLIALISQDVPGALFMAVLAAAGFTIPGWIPKLRSGLAGVYVNWNLNRLKKYQAQGLPQYEYECFFNLDGLVWRNPLTNAGEQIPYARFWRMGETERVFLLAYRGGRGPLRRFIPIFKACLTPEQQASLIPFLKERCPRLQILTQKGADAEWINTAPPEHWMKPL